jgi:hypothetical protein
MTFQFTCSTCGELHEGVPTFGADAPYFYSELPEEEQASRGLLGTDDCIIDGKQFFVRGCIEISVHGEAQPFAWGAWVNVSEADFNLFEKAFHNAERSQVGPFAGYLANALPGYPDTLNLHVRAHLRNDGIRPYIEVAPSEHPLHQEQCRGMSPARLAQIYQLVMHPTAGAGG